MSARTRRRGKRDLALISLGVQLYLVDKHGLSATDTTIVFMYALADTIGASLKPEGSAERVIEALVPELKHLAEWRRANPGDMPLGSIIAEYKRAGGKVRTH